MAPSRLNLSLVRHTEEYLPALAVEHSAKRLGRLGPLTSGLLEFHSLRFPGWGGLHHDYRVRIDQRHEERKPPLLYA